MLNAYFIQAKKITPLTTDDEGPILNPTSIAHDVEPSLETLAPRNKISSTRVCSGELSLSQRIGSACNLQEQQAMNLVKLD